MPTHPGVEPGEPTGPAVRFPRSWIPAGRTGWLWVALAVGSAVLGAYLGHDLDQGALGVVVAMVVLVAWAPWLGLCWVTGAVLLFTWLGTPVKAGTRAWARSWFWRGWAWQMVVLIPLAFFASWGNSAPS